MIQGNDRINDQCREVELPRLFLERFSERFGSTESDALIQAITHQPSPISIRINKDKVRLIDDHLYNNVPWCNDAIYVGGVPGAKERPIFAADPWWHAGAYYVQEASSMFIEQWVQQERHRLLSDEEADGAVWLDLCAAPGGKSTILKNALPDGAILIANEPDNIRSKVLQENIIRWGCDNVVVTHALPESLARCGLRADLIVIDAPCSGEGMFRKEPQAIDLWSEEKVMSLALLQHEIIMSACDMLKPGGLLIYSTCTFNREENEAHLDALLAENSAYSLVEQPIPDGVIEKEKGVYHFFPHRILGEGFTLFAVRKTKEKKSMNSNLINSRLTLDKVTNQLRRGGVHILQSGIDSATIKGRDQIPSHSLAMSKEVTKSGYRITEIDNQTALKYLKREGIILPPYRGIEGVSYHGIPLGWVKNIGNRANNLFPKGWALRNQALGVNDMPHFEVIMESVL